MCEFVFFRMTHGLPALAILLLLIASTFLLGALSSCCSQAVAKEANAALLNLQPSAELPVKVEVAPVLAIISRELRSEQEPTHLEALRW